MAEVQTPVRRLLGDGKATCSVPEAARILDIGRDLGYTLAAEGRLPVLKLGRKLRVSVVGLERMLAGEAPVPPEVTPWTPDAA